MTDTSQNEAIEVTPPTPRFSAPRAERINHPAHYGGDTQYETIKVLEAWLSPEQFIGFLRGNAIKYMSRLGKKPGEDASDDMAKAQWYQNYEAEFRKRKRL